MLVYILVLYIHVHVDLDLDLVDGIQCYVYRIIFKYRFWLATGPHTPPPHHHYHNRHRHSSYYKKDPKQKQNTRKKKKGTEGKKEKNIPLPPACVSESTSHTNAGTKRRCSSRTPQQAIQAAVVCSQDNPGRATSTPPTPGAARRIWSTTA